MPKRGGGGLLSWLDRLRGRDRPGEGQSANGVLAQEQASVSLGPDDAARWSIVHQLFGDVLEIPTTERMQWLAARTKGDPSLIGDVVSLLEAHEGDGPLEVLRERLPLSRVPRSVEDMAGRSVLHYEVVEKLEGGGMGVVYKARDTRLDRTVALKFLSPGFLTDGQAKERFLVEARTAASLDHPNVCTIHEVGETEDGLLFIAMAFYEGESLRHRIRRGRVPLDEALAVARQVCQGLVRAADHGIIHRDIKPGNIMFAADGSVKIVDFGLAKVRGDELTVSGALRGTVAYMSPEQARGEPLDQRTDVWSAGVVLYEMLAATRPFQGGMDHAVLHAILHEEPTDLPALVPDVPKGVAALVSRTLQKDPAHRYPDAASLLADLDCLIANPGNRGLALVSRRLHPEGERRLITVLSCAIGGLDDLLDHTDSEQIGRELAQLRTWMEGVVEDYGGIVHEFTEHSMSALFGVPAAHEDDGLRAVRAGRELTTRRGRRAPPEGTFELRVAAAAEYVAVSRSDAGHRPYRVGGSVIRDATLLAAGAAAGEVLMAPALHRAVAPFMETEERPPVLLSPDRPPVAALAITGESHAASRLEASVSKGLTQFIGRSEELRTLSRSFASAMAGEGSVVAVIGDAGVGKSRLLHEFRSSLADEGIRYLQGRCQSYGRLTGFMPFLQCARSILGLGRQTTPLDQHQLAERVTALDPDLAAYGVIIQRLLSVEGEEQFIDGFSAEEQTAAAVGVLTSLLTLGSRPQGLVVLLEDWHWCDEGSNEVLRQLAEMVSAYPVLVVVTSRTPVLEGAAGLHTFTSVDLQPLDAQSAGRLTRSALGGARLSPALREHIESRTGGNPFFIEELCHHLLETKAVVIEGETASPLQPLDQTSIPSTVQAVLKTRLEGLDPESREVLRSASVIGREFSAEVLAKVVPSPSRLDVALGSLRASGLIQRTAMIPGPRYRFKHALTLDVAYASLLERQRRERHALVGAAIESVHRDQLDEFARDLARHFAEACDWSRAVEYGLDAAARAGRLWRWAEAVSTLDEVEEWIDHRQSTAQERAEALIRLFFTKEKYLDKLGRRDEARAAIERLEELVPGEPSRDRAALLARKVEILTMDGRNDEARTALDRVMVVADACGADEERIQALRGMGLALWRLGRPEEAIEPLTEVLAYARTHAPPDAVLQDLLNVGRVERARENWKGALAVAQEARALEPECGPIEQGMSLHFMGQVHRSLGQPHKALDALMAANEKHAEVRLPELAPLRNSVHYLSIGAVQFDLGEIEAAMAAYDASLELARRSNRADHVSRVLAVRGNALLGLNRPDEAIPQYREALTLLEGRPTEAPAADVAGYLAMALEATNDPEAVEAWASVERMRTELGDTAGALDAAERAAGLPFHSPAARRTRIESALALAVDAQDRAAQARLRNALAILEWRAGDYAAASTSFEAAAASLEDSPNPDQLGTVLNGWGATLFHSGKHAEAERVLSRALEVNRSALARAREADTLSALGKLFLATGDEARAIDCYEQCLERRRDTRDRTGEGWALHRLAGACRSSGAVARASELNADALRIAREVGDDELAERTAGVNS